jgi:hypothetical protein
MPNLRLRGKKVLRQSLMASLHTHRHAVVAGACIKFKRKTLRTSNMQYLPELFLPDWPNCKARLACGWAPARKKTTGCSGAWRAYQANQR